MGGIPIIYIIIVIDRRRIAEMQMSSLLSIHALSHVLHSSKALEPRTK